MFSNITFYTYSVQTTDLKFLSELAPLRAASLEKPHLLFENTSSCSPESLTCQVSFLKRPLLSCESSCFKLLYDMSSLVIAEGGLLHSLRKPEPFYKHFLPLIHQCSQSDGTAETARTLKDWELTGAVVWLMPLSCAATAASLNMQLILNTSWTAKPAIHAGGLSHCSSLHLPPIFASWMRNCI